MQSPLAHVFSAEQPVQTLPKTPQAESVVPDKQRPSGVQQPPHVDAQVGGCDGPHAANRKTRAS